MRQLWVRRTVSAPAPAAWRVLTDVMAWPSWGPSIRSASIDRVELALGTTGRVETVGGAHLPFEITEFDPGRQWAWRVAGLPATDHVVTDLGEGSCEVAFGVPWFAAPYLAVCRVALARIDDLAQAVAGVDR